MTTAEQTAIETFQNLPDKPRLELAAAMSEYAEKWEGLASHLTNSAAQLDAGQGIPETDLFAKLRERYEG